MGSRYIEGSPVYPRSVSVPTPCSARMGRLLTTTQRTLASKQSFDALRSSPSSDSNFHPPNHFPPSSLAKNRRFPAEKPQPARSVVWRQAIRPDDVPAPPALKPRSNAKLAQKDLYAIVVLGSRYAVPFLATGAKMQTGKTRER